MDRWGYNYLTEKKTLWDEAKLLVTSNFYFSNNVFKGCLMRQNEYLWSKGLNSLSNNNILASTKFKPFAEGKINVAEMTISLSDRLENIVGKGENAGYQHFLLFPQCFQ